MSAWIGEGQRQGRRGELDGSRAGTGVGFGRGSYTLGRDSYTLGRGSHTLGRGSYTLSTEGQKCGGEGGEAQWGERKSRQRST